MDEETRAGDAGLTLVVVSTDPVKQILSTPGWRASKAPTTEPFPGITLIVPAGRPAFWAMRATSRALSGVYSAGFRTTVFPAARAGATFHATNMRGKFHGTIWPTTPRGSRNV